MARSWWYAPHPEAQPKRKIQMVDASAEVEVLGVVRANRNPLHRKLVTSCANTRNGCMLNGQVSSDEHTSSRMQAREQT